MTEQDTIMRLIWGDFPEITATNIEEQQQQARNKQEWLAAHGFITPHFCNWHQVRRGPARNWLYTVRFRDIQEYLAEHPELAPSGINSSRQL